jgi:hypothetical protein
MGIDVKVAGESPATSWRGGKQPRGTSAEPDCCDALPTTGCAAGRGKVE